MKNSKQANIIPPGYTLRQGTRRMGRVGIAWDWQLFDERGNYVRSLRRTEIESLGAAGALRTQGRGVHR